LVNIHQDTALHESTVQILPSLQTKAGHQHIQVVQVSVVVHTLPSSQLVPSVTFDSLHSTHKPSAVQTKTPAVHAFPSISQGSHNVGNQSSISKSQSSSNPLQISTPEPGVGVLQISQSAGKSVSSKVLRQRLSSTLASARVHPAVNQPKAT
jgi:hypothetical protein